MIQYVVKLQNILAQEYIYNVCMFKKGQIHNEKFVKDSRATVLGSPQAQNPWILGQYSGEGWLQACCVLKLLFRLPHLAITGDRTVIR